MRRRSPRSPSPDDLLLLIFTSGSTGRTEGGAADPGTSGARGHRPDGLPCPTTSSTARCRSSTATRSMAMVFPVASAAARRSCSSGSSRPRGSCPTCARYHCTFSSTVGRALAYILATPASDARQGPRPEVRARAGVVDRGHEGVQAPVRPARVRRLRLERERDRHDPEPGPAPRGAGRAGRPASTSRSSTRPPTRSVRRARFDDDGKLVNADEAIGELVGRNALDRFEGYYNNDEATAERTRNGWYWSGDLAYRDEDGVFYFAGRNADWIRVDGENFAAAPVERIIPRFPGVAGVAVYGVPDERTADDQVMAAIELRRRRRVRSRRVRRVPRRATRPRHEVVAALRARRSVAPGHRDEQDRQGAAAPGPLGLDRRRPRLLAARAARPASATHRQRPRPRSCGGSSPTAAPRY